MPVKVGIPRALAYYAFLPMWQTYFEELGAQVVISPPTDKDILDRGVEEAVSDACVPVKLFLGHVRYLAGRVDYLFIPRLVNIVKGRTRVFCPKFLGLPDMVRHSMENLPPILDPRVDFRRGKIYFWRECRRVADLFTPSVYRQARALILALLELRRFNRLKRLPMTFYQALEHREGGTGATSSKPSGRRPVAQDLTLGVVGYPYALYDEYTSVDLLGRLAELGVRVVTPDMLHDRLLTRFRPWFDKQLFWTFSDRAARAGFYFLTRGGVDGVIHVTAFGCGPDSMVNKLLELEFKQRTLPLLTLTIDEHTGEAGIETRVEAFVDMVRRRKELAG